MSTLACYGFNGTDPRVYYVDSKNRVNELEWVQQGWVNNVLPGNTARQGKLGGAIAVMDSVAQTRGCTTWTRKTASTNWHGKASSG